MIRKALLVVCGVMLVASIAVAGLSHVRSVIVEWRRTSGWTWAAAHDGELRIAHDPGNRAGSSTGGKVLYVSPAGTDWAFLEEYHGFLLVAPWSTPTPPPYRFVAVPAWTLPCVLGLGMWLLARPLVIVRYRRRRGTCVACGYDLTGNESGVCPECGKPTVMTP